MIDSVVYRVGMAVQVERWSMRNVRTYSGQYHRGTGMHRCNSHSKFKYQLLSYSRRWSSRKVECDESKGKGKGKMKHFSTCTSAYRYPAYLGSFFRLQVPWVDQHFQRFEFYTRHGLIIACQCVILSIGMGLWVGLMTWTRTWDEREYFSARIDSGNLYVY